MAFGSDSFPLGPNGQYPRQRINSYGNMISPPPSVEEIYEAAEDVRLPIVEKDYDSSVKKVAMEEGKVMREDSREFRPRYAPQAVRETDDDGDHVEGLSGRSFMSLIRYGVGVNRLTRVRKGSTGLQGLSAVTSSGRKIARTWKYGRNTYYSTVPDANRIVERGQLIGNMTKVIDTTRR